MTREEKHAARVKCGMELSANIEDFIRIQEDYIVWLEDQIEKCSGMSLYDYCKKNPRT